MNDITFKTSTLREAIAEGKVFCGPDTVAHIKNNTVPKGNIVEFARAAGFFGAKKTDSLLPHCHPVTIDGMDLQFEIQEDGVKITGSAKSVGRTGIEMEILTGVSIAALTIYDMLKPLDNNLEISGIKLLNKKGGKTDREKYFQTPPLCAVLTCSDEIKSGNKENHALEEIIRLLNKYNVADPLLDNTGNDPEIISQLIVSFAEKGYKFIFAVGGTGPGENDTTFEAINSVIDKTLDGITDAMRIHAYARNPLAMTSRLIAGSIGGSTVISLPGGKDGARECLEAILPAVFKIQKMLLKKVLMISVKEAQSLILQHAGIFTNETILLQDAFGRILAEDILADRNYPPFNRAAMDGFAINSADYTEKGIKEFILAGELFAGHFFNSETTSGQCIKIMTGSPTPAQFDCIIPVELSKEDDHNVSFISDTIRPWMNIAREGEDCLQGDMILPQNTMLHPPEIAILAVLGIGSLKVKSIPKVAIISTGDELVPVGHPVSPFQIRDSNAYALLTFFQSKGIRATKREIVNDNPENLLRLLKEVIDYDIIVLSGGVSMGAADYVPSTLANLGVEKVFHKIALKPGKPLWFGKSSSGTAFFGLPGNPLSCQVCFKLFIEPYTRACQGLKKREDISFPLLDNKKKNANFDEFFPVYLTNNGLQIIPFNGSGDVTATKNSTGIALHSLESGDLKKGDHVIYIPWI